MRIESKLKATVMAVALATIPVALHAAGLGRLNVLSGLGQPLRAEIDLVAVQPSEVESLRAALASPEAYREAQIDFPPTSLGLRFNLEKRSGGQYYIAVNSAQSVNEPFLDFLLELKWEGGRVLREYTALLDPVGYNATTSPASRPTTSSSEVGETSPKFPLPKPMVGTRSSSKAETRSQESGSGESASNTSGSTHTVKQGDTLAGIARENAVEGVSLEQMLVGLYRANQDAFDGKNMNRLKKGRILSVPDKETLTSISRREAAQEIRVQADDWHGYRSRVAGAAAPSRGDQASGSGKISTHVEERAAPRESGSKDNLKLSKGEEGKLKERVQSLEEESTSRQKALNEANQRVAELERTNKKLEDLLALKSKQGAELQKQAQAAEKQSKPLEPAPEAKPAEPKVEPPKPEAAAPTPPVETPPAVPPEATAVEAKPAEPVVPPAPVEAEKPKKPRPPVVEPEPEEPSLLEDPMVLGGGGLLALLLGGGAFWAIRRQKKNDFVDSVITGSDLKTNTMVGNTGGAVISTGVTENSFLTDFSRAGLGTIDTDEVDPIAEAEVYMAYGRDAQAEEILKDALARDGSRQEVRLKLLEIYAARKNAVAFEAAARELYASNQGQGPVWAQAAEMGRALDPNNSLYQQKSPVDTGALDKTMVMSAGTLGDISSKPASPAPAAAAPAPVPVPAPVPAPPPPAMPEMSFDLDTPAPAPAPMAHKAVEEPVAAGADTGLDFNLSNFSSAKAAAPAPAAASLASGDSDILSLDIPLDLGTDNASASSASLASSDLASDLDFDFELNESSAASDMSLGSNAMSLDMDMAPESGGSADISDFGAEMDDPVTTKIDLARAYIDMGDKEGAREILQEAMSEGTAEQKSTANSLLAQL
ncbi:FimV/HubP family polar landmark protein [Chitinimonas sp. PSY-7]|uniref:FimV/HubP family polar landmark protein n=1 Tax=Chitinimonas sp. PSY-7 TaxID=3459088 RepID=UPI00403FCE4C